jgi:putative ABC transport system substrate-binding protein
MRPIDEERRAKNLARRLFRVSEDVQPNERLLPGQKETFKCSAGIPACGLPGPLLDDEMPGTVRQMSSRTLRTNLVRATATRDAFGDRTMDRRTFLTTFACLLTPAMTVEAQQPANVFRIGILGTYPPTTPEFAHLWEAFVQGLRDLGYIEGQNLVVDRRFMEGKAERLPELAAELVRLNVRVIVAGGQPPPVAAKRATATIPIVMTNFSDPVGLGLVTNLARPGGNITGLALLTVELVTKQLQLLTQAVPKVSRVALLTNPSNPGAALQRRDAETAARALGLQLQVLEAQRLDELAGAFDAMTSQRAGAVLLPGDSVLYFYRKQIADLAIKNRLPALFAPREFAEAGGLMAYGANIADLYRRAATYVDRILKGANPGDLSIEQPTKFELVINVKTAKALGITIPQSLLLRADEVIQ